MGLERHHSELVQAADLGLHEILKGNIGPGRSAPQRQRLGDQALGADGIPSLKLMAASPGPPGEDLGVDVAGRDGEQVAAADRPQDALAFQLEWLQALRSRVMAICRRLTAPSRSCPQTASIKASTDTARSACNRGKASSATCRGPPITNRRSSAHTSTGPKTRNPITPNPRRQRYQPDGRGGAKPLLSARVRSVTGR